MTVLKDSEGFLFVSRIENLKISMAEQRRKVIGRMVSNFFGTEFKCTLEDLPYQ
jgi:hypothetical protein